MRKLTCTDDWFVSYLSWIAEKELCIELCLSESSTLSKYTNFVNVPPTSSPKIFPIQSPLLLSSPEDSDSWLCSEVLLFKSMLASDRSFLSQGHLPRVPYFLSFCKSLSGNSPMCFTAPTSSTFPSTSLTKLTKNRKNRNVNHKAVEVKNPAIKSSLSLLIISWKLKAMLFSVRATYVRIVSLNAARWLFYTRVKLRIT